MELTGIIPPMVSPVTNGTGDINVEVTKAFTQYLVDGGVHGLFPAGSIGEFPSLTRSQRAVLIEAVTESAPEIPVLAGCGGTSIAQVKTLIADASSAGADAAVVVTPYYFSASQNGLCTFYEQIAEDAELPIILYNIPQLTGQNLAKDSVARLSEHPNIIGMKDSSRSFEYFANVGRRVPDTFSLLQGSPELAIPSLDIGADGLVPGPSNVLPGLLANLYHAHTSGDRTRALEIIQSKLLPLIDVMRPISSAAALKFLLQEIGFAVGNPLPPLEPVTADQRSQLEASHQNLIQPNLSRSAD